MGPLLDTIFTIFSLIIIVCVIVAVVLTAEEKIKAKQFEQKEIPKFSKQWHFDPYPQTVNIENQYDCNAKSLRKCDINDSTTLFGCKELVVRCHHFDADTPYIENNQTAMIPRNDTPTEGYALAITTISDACNAYHGDMTLVAANADSTEYMLVCTCKNPGYIGNESLLGNCTSVFICNGAIDDIDKPLSEINCRCEQRQMTVRYEDGLPVCKDMLVHEANERYSDWSNIVSWSSNRQIDSRNYNPTVSGNLRTSRLLDPCRNSIHDPSVEVPDARYSARKSQCLINESGVPIVNNLLKFTSSAEQKVGISAVLATGKYESIRFSDNVAGERKIYGLIVDGLKFSPKYANTRVVVHPTNGINLGDDSGITFESKPKFVAPKCVAAWPNYDCSSWQEKDSVTVGGITIPIVQPCPSEFLWSRELWEDSEDFVMRSLELTTSGYSMSALRLAKLDDLQTYGLQWAPINSSAYNGVVYFEDANDYAVHKATLT